MGRILTRTVVHHEGEPEVTSYTYDAHGRMLSGGTFDFQYDAAGNLVSSTLALQTGTCFNDEPSAVSMQYYYECQP